MNQVDVAFRHLARAFSGVHVHLGTAPCGWGCPKNLTARDFIDRVKGRA